jgi:rubrerythrin
MSEKARLQAVLDQLSAGRTKDLTCPFCESATLKKEPGDYGPEMVCPACKKFIEIPNTDY